MLIIKIQASCGQLVTDEQELPHVKSFNYICHLSEIKKTSLNFSTANYKLP